MGGLGEVVGMSLEIIWEVDQTILASCRTVFGNTNLLDICNKHVKAYKKLESICWEGSQRLIR